MANQSPACSVEVPDLSVEFCGLKLQNPLVLASGALGETADRLIPYLEAGAAAAVTRTTRLQCDPSRSTFPSPHLSVGERQGYLLNCEWGNLVDWRYWVDEGFQKVANPERVIMSISGRSIHDCVELAKRFDEVGGFAMFEINVSCRHSNELHGDLQQDEKHTSALISALKSVLSKPVVVKLGHGPTLARLARVAAECGADGIATTNSIGPGLDLGDDGRPSLGVAGGIGGMSGRAIFPIALECVHKVVEAVDIPVMGIGGVASYRDVLKMIMVGATCVQIYTEAYFRGPELFRSLKNDLVVHLSKNNYSSINELRGISRRYLNQATNLAPIVPIAEEANCTDCRKCLAMCLEDALRLRPLEIIDDRCIGCGACIDVCPPSANALKRGK